MLFHAALFFGFLALVTTVGSMFPRVIRARIWFGLPFGVVLLALGTAPAIVLSHAEQLDVDLAATVVVVALLIRLAMRRWSWIGAQLFAAVTLASLAYLLYAGSITYVVARSPIYLPASTLLLVLEVAALSLSLSYCSRSSTRSVADRTRRILSTRLTSPGSRSRCPLTTNRSRLSRRP